MSVESGRPFHEWLRANMKAKRMSQRQLAQRSGVHHSTISRLLLGDRTPSLGTATKLAQGLRVLREGSDAPGHMGVMAVGASHPTARVEHALRADDMLDESQVRQAMSYYLALRQRRLAVRQPVATATVQAAHVTRSQAEPAARLMPPRPAA